MRQHNSLRHAPARLEESTAFGVPAFRMSNGSLAVHTLPSRGGKIASLVSAQTGREWLWRNPHLPILPASYGDSYVAKHDTGGIDECFPTVDACECPVGAGPWQGVGLPDHGELVTQPWIVLGAEVDSDGTARLALEARGVRFPCRFKRTMSLGMGAAPLRLEYELENLSPYALPFTWCLHPAFCIAEGMQIVLPRGAPTRTAYTLGRAPAKTGSTFPWPESPSGYDLSSVPARGEDGFTMKLFSGPLRQGRVGLRRECETLQIGFDPRTVPYVAMWLNYGMWSGAGTPPYFNVVIEPSIGDADSLREALADRDTAVHLPAGQTMRWELEISLSYTDIPAS